MNETTYTSHKPKSTPHCSLCGAGDDGHCGEGYSSCCSETICYGGPCVILLAKYTDGDWETIHFYSQDDADYFIADQGDDA